MNTDVDAAMDESSDGLTIGQRLAQIRESAGLTQVALAGLLETRQGYISAIETGARMPSRELLRRWAEACGGRMDWVYQREGGAPIGEVGHYLDTMPAEHAQTVLRLVRLLAITDAGTSTRIMAMVEQMLAMAESQRRG